MTEEVNTTPATNNEDDTQWTNDDFLSFNRPSSDNDDNEEEGEAVDDLFAQEENDITTANDNTNQSLEILPPPPWMMMAASSNGGSHTNNRYYYYVNPLVRLHNEIVSFCKLMEPQDYELEQREELITKFRNLAQSCFNKEGEDCKVMVFGSHATGLLLPTSDIDISIMLSSSLNNNKTKEDKDTTSEAQKITDQEEMDEWNMENVNNASSPLHRLATKLRNDWIDDLKYLEVIERTRVPLVKFITKEGISMDISFNQENGPKAAQLMKTFLLAMPPLRPLTFVLKYYLKARGMNEPYSGGIGSYMLQLMIVSFLQHREREIHNNNNNHRDKSSGGIPPYNLGCLLLEFMELYGMDLNYFTTGISVRHDGFYFPKGSSKPRREVFLPSLTAGGSNRLFTLGVENPLDPTMDVGKASFKISTIQRSFSIAFKSLLAHVTEPLILVRSILAVILPPSPEMQQRAAQLNNTPQIIDLTTTDNDKYNGNTTIRSPDRKRRRRC